MKGVYLVTDRDCLQGKTLECVVELAAQGGVIAVQLREKDLPTRMFVQEARQCQKILAPYKIPLIINDRIDVALAVEADGVHIGQRDMPYRIARKLLGPEAIIGLSVESMEQVREAEGYDVDYLGVSAIFGTPTKTDTTYLWGLEGLQDVKKTSKHPLVAIGGINASNAAEIFKTGADSIAVVSAICANPDPLKATRELQGICLRNFS